MYKFGNSVRALAHMPVDFGNIEYYIYVMTNKYLLLFTPWYLVYTVIEQYRNHMKVV